MAQQTDDALEIYSGLLLENFEGYEDNDFAIWLEVGCELFHTLLGSGGAGKTRLAPQAANERRQAYEEGVAFVALESITDPGALMFRVADSLGVSLSTQDEPLCKIVDAMGDRRFFVLDDFEHPTDAAEQLSALVLACIRFNLLVNSQERLWLDEERTLFLGGFKAVFLEVAALILNGRAEHERSSQLYGSVITPSPKLPRNN